MVVETPSGVELSSDRGAKKAAPPPESALDEARVLVAEVEAELGAIEQAIERLEKGTYSTCELCGSPIEPERLVAAPTERRCGEHGASR
ncbi:MAG: TraR/DksA C4-type zinc finger protein [Acidimicrobiales bacterium]|jgi:RNA polymerase-binding transcription factor DksA